MIPQWAICCQHCCGSLGSPLASNRTNPSDYRLHRDLAMSMADVRTHADDSRQNTITEPDDWNKSVAHEHRSACALCPVMITPPRAHNNRTDLAPTCFNSNPTSAHLALESINSPSSQLFATPNPPLILNSPSLQLFATSNLHSLSSAPLTFPRHSPPQSSSTSILILLNPSPVATSASASRSIIRISRINIYAVVLVTTFA
jgi:hypothetical protein